MFFYDIDYCLGAKVGIADILVAHYKTPELYGKYPDGMKSMESYERYFYTKHGMAACGEAGDTRALCATREDYDRYGHEALFKMFSDKYNTPACA